MSFLPLASRRPLDFGFLVDSSSDISSNNWQRILSYMRNVIDGLQNISPQPYGTRVGIVSYAAVPRMHFDFNFLWGPNLNKERLKGLVNSLYRQPGSDRKIDNAVDFTRENLFSLRGGARPNSRRVRKTNRLTCFVFVCLFVCLRYPVLIFYL